jgi:protein-S-isoprenylcysteine O-methyltransferase Ste14
VIPARLFEGLQLAVQASLGCLGLARACALYARGVRVVAVDWERSPIEQLQDLALLVCFLVWNYEVVAEGWPLGFHLVPAPLRRVVVESVALHALGALLSLAGLLCFAMALHAFGASWRIGIDRDAPGPLTTRGIFGWSRNPIYLAFDLLVVGSFLTLGRLVFLALALAISPLLHALIRREERFLGELHGEPYRDWCRCVGRYVTWPRP